MAGSDKRARRRRIAAGCVLLVPALAACNAIIGLSDFEKVQCAGGKCPGDDGGFDTGRPDAKIDADVDGSDFDGGGAAPVSWAKWPMPNFDGVEGGVPPNPHVYSASPSSVEDKVTLLTWERAQDAGDGASTLKTYDEAVAYCAKLAPGMWRMPKRIELITLMDFTNPARRFDPLFGGQGGVYWTSSEKRPFSPSAPTYWTVAFDTGVVESRPASGTAFVRCVRSQP